MQEIVVSKTDSPINCNTRLLRNAPNTLRKPTSFERPTARIVERFIKLMQAIKRINIAIERKIYTTVLSPCLTLSKVTLSKYTSFKGVSDKLKIKPYLRISLP